jgi:ribosomal protein S18 acetylase RimI-like enzyme
MPPVFKLTPAAQPTGLGAALAAAGYRAAAPTSVQTAPLADLPPPPAGGAVTMTDEATARWREAFCRLNAVPARHQPAMAQLLARIVPARTFLTLEQEGEIVAVGLAVAERGWVGVFDLVTAAAWRNRGLGRQANLRLLHWGRAQGAQQAYLQVMRDNAPALHLYEMLGFREAYPYWYRVK